MAGGSSTTRTLKRLPQDGRPLVTLDSQDEWFTVLHDVFGLRLPEPDRTALWARVHTTHERWPASQAQYSR